MKTHPPIGKTLNLVGASLLGSILSSLRLVTGLIRVKLIAFVFGAAGIGYLSQANEVWVLAVTIGSLMLGAGLVTQLKKTSDSDDQILLIGSALAVQGLLLIVSLGIAVFFAEALAAKLFGDGAKAFWIYLIAVSVPFAVFSSGALEAVLFAKGKFSSYIAVSSVATLLSTVVIVIGVWNENFESVFFGWLVNGVLMLTGYIWVLHRDFPIRHFRHLRVDFGRIGLLLSQSFWILLAHLAQGIFLVSIRSRVIEDLGEVALGLIQIPVALTAYATPFLTNQLWGHFHPTISAAKSKRSELKVLKDTLKWTLFLQFCFALTAYGFGRELIILAYTSEFLPSYGYFFEYLLGNCFYFFAIVFGIFMIAKSKSYLYFAGLLFYFASWFGLVYLLIGEWGLHSVSRGHLFSALIPATLAFAWLIKSAGIRDSYSVIGVFFGSLAIFAFQHYAVQSLDWSWVGFVLPLVYASFGVPTFLRALRSRDSGVAAD